jgi:hypothetical protein
MVARVMRSDDDGTNFGRLALICYAVGTLVRSIAEVPYLERSGVARDAGGN